jgi:CBS domain-containing protein
MEALRVSEVMNPSVITVSEEAPLSEVARLLGEHSISGLVVVDHSGQMVGIISQSDLVRSWREGSDYATVMNSPVSRYMTRDVISCAPHRSLSYAMQLLSDRGIHRLVVCEPHYGGRFVTDRMMPVGILTQTDIVRALISLLDNGTASETPSAGEQSAGP